MDALLKEESVTVFKNMLQATYEGTQLTFTETVLLSFLSLTLSMLLFAEALSEETTQGNSKK